MVLAGNENIREILEEIIERQRVDNKRIERLETLEFEKYAKSDGCVRWLDYDIVAGAASARVDVTPNPYELGNYGWTHLTVFWALHGTGGTTVRMTINNIVLASYGYNYSYSVGSGIVETAVGQDGQTSMVVGRFIRTGYYVVGWYHIPYFPIPMNVHTFGQWVAYDTQLEAGTQVERGKFGGVYVGAAQRVMRVDMFASAGNITGYVYLYGWCPTWDVAIGPPD